MIFEREEEARRVLAVLAKRFTKYGLRLHPEKTRMGDFRSPPRAGRGGSQRERSFELLRFTHFWGRSRKEPWAVQRKTAKDRFSLALREEVGRWCQVHRHWRVPTQQAALSRKLQDHYAYYGITGNARALWHRPTGMLCWGCHENPPGGIRTVLVGMVSALAQDWVAVVAQVKVIR